MLRHCLIFLTGAVFLFHAVVSSAQDAPEFRFYGGNYGYSGETSRFRVAPFDPPVIRSADGYSPAVSAPVSKNPGASFAPLPTVWTPPTTFTWEFGDGTPAVVVEERRFVIHRYAEPGTYTVTLTASNFEGDFAVFSRQFEVRKSKPGWYPVQMVASKADGAVINFSAAPSRPIDDDNLFIWEFGDGESTEGKSLFEVSHRYQAGGKYKGRVTQVDSEGNRYEKPLKIFVASSDLPTVAPTSVEDLPDTVVDQFRATYSGDLNGEIDAQVFGGGTASVYLLQVKPNRCRLIFNAIDDDQLILARGIVDLTNFPEGPAVYRLSPTRLNIDFFAKPDQYLDRRSTFMGGALGQAMLDPSKVGPPGSGVVGRDANFGWVGGKLELTVVPGNYLIGKMNGRLKSVEITPNGKVTDYISIKAQFSFRVGLTPFIKTGCQPSPFEVKRTIPKDLSSHQGSLSNRGGFLVRLTSDLDPDSVTTGKLQLGYPNSNGDFVPAPGRLLVGRNSIRFVPDQPLRAGVRYTARLRSGDQGILSSSGQVLSDQDGSGWRQWTFSTRLDFAATAGNQQTLSCHMFQTVRDAPLIPEKPAVPRIYANWVPHSDVHPEAQVREFAARVSLVDKDQKILASTRHVFVRPDLWASKGIDTASARHTAQVFGFTPNAITPAFTGVKVEVRRAPGGPLVWMYNSLCETPIWPRQLGLTVDTFVLMAGELADPANRVTAIPFLRKLIGQVKRYAWQTLPFQNISIAAPRFIDPKDLDSRPAVRDQLGFEVGLDSRCKASCWLTGATAESFGGIETWLRRKSHADIVLLLGSSDVFGMGGSTSFTKLGGMANISMGVAIPGLYETDMVNGTQSRRLIDGKSTNRTINGIVHEFGHALTLHHRPVSDWLHQRREIIKMRESSRAAGTAIKFKGIEAFRMETDGQSGWNFSSTEGNQSGHWLVPLMFPGTVDLRYAMPTYDNYREMQKFLESYRP